MTVSAERITRISGRAIPLSGHDIDTDRIMPARYLRVVSFEGLEQHLFEDDRKTDAAHPFNDARYAGATILVVNGNFGCGSSREHAPQGLARYGIKAIVGESFSEIFFGNSVALGMPCVSADPSTLATLMQLVEADPSTELRVDLDTMRVSAGATAHMITLPAAARESFQDGTWDATGLLLDRFEEVEAVAARLPYVGGTWR